MPLSLLLPELPASIPPAESAELAARLHALANSGLPLEGGLRALADEVGRPRLAAVLRRLAARLEKGEPLEKAIAAPGCRLPIVLRGLIVAGVHSGRLPEVLDQFAALTRRRQDLRQRMLLTFAYPVVLLGISAMLLIFFRMYVTDGFAQIFRDFGTKLPNLTIWYLHFSGTVGWTVLAAAIFALVVPMAAALLPSGGWLGRVSCQIPIIGPVVRHERYVQFTRLMATLLDAQAPLPNALGLAAIGMRGTFLDAQCRAASAAVEAGMPLNEAFLRARFLDSLCCLVDWGQKRNALAEAFHSAAEAFEARGNSHTALLNMIVLPLFFMVLIFFIGLSVVALFMPLLSLISCLSGGQ
jgi:type II secretory pathway component PulF